VGDTVYLITDSLADLESVDTAAYVTPKLIPSGSDIRALILPGIKLERMEDGQWKSSPEKLPQAKIQARVTAWCEAQDYDVAAYKKTNKRLPSQATVKLAGGQALRFKVTVRKRELIMARPNLGVEYHLPMSSANSMLKPGSLPSNIPSS
jgi:beta-lactamase class A